MKKTRLIKAQHANNIDSLINFMVQNKPFDDREVQKYHEELKQSLNRSIELTHILERLSKEKPAYSRYYQGIFQSLNNLANSLKVPH